MSGSYLKAKCFAKAIILIILEKQIPHTVFSDTICGILIRNL